MLTTLAIAQNDIACYAKNRTAIFWTFLGPALCMWFFGFLNPTAVTVAPVSIMDSSHSQLAAVIMKHLQADGHIVTTADHLSGNGLEIEVQPSQQVVLHTGPNETEAERAVRYELQEELSGPSSGSAASIPVAVSHPKSLSGYQRTVPAYLIMFLTMNLLMSGAGFAQERASGRMRRLLTAPVPAVSVIGGRLLSRLFVAWVQMLFLFSIGVFILHIQWAQHALSLVFVLSLYVLAMGSIGILIGTWFHDPDHASAAAMWGALMLAPLTGLWWPVELMPRALQLVGNSLPTGWVMQTVNSMLAYGTGPAEFQSTFIGLIAVAVVAIWLSAKGLQKLA